MLKYDILHVREKLNYLPEELVSHCERVREVCLSLAHRWSVSPDKAEFVALTHDLARVLSREDLISMARRYNIIHDQVELRHPVLLHGAVSAEMLRHEWGIEDKEVLEAVACHTNGCADMTPLAKILFLADKTEPEKDYPRLAKVKELASFDLDRAVLELLDQLLQFHVEQRHLIHPSTLAARNSLVIKVGKSPQV